LNHLFADKDVSKNKNKKKNCNKFGVRRRADRFLNIHEKNYTIKKEQE
jgi:hypothetical protein